MPVTGAVTVRAGLPPDDLPLDGEVVLPPLAQAPLGVRIEGLPATLARSVREAAAATGAADLDGSATEAALEVSLDGAATASHGAPASSPGAGGVTAATAAPWRVRIRREPDAVAYIGPFAVDGRHPLTAGLAAEGLVWAAGGAGGNPPGAPVIGTGTVVLLADEERADGGHDLHLRLREDLSTLARAPAWPVLWWNLLAWRRSELTGPARVLERLGEVATLRLPAGASAARVRGPGWDRELRVVGPAAPPGAASSSSGGVARWLPPRTGEYAIEAGGERFAVSVATLQRAESDLRDRVKVRHGRLAQALPPRGRREMAWGAGLAALALLVAEGALLAGARGKGRANDLGRA